jgi:hypothetical protein
VLVWNRRDLEDSLQAQVSALIEPCRGDHAFALDGRAAALVPSSHATVALRYVADAYV